MDQYCYLPHDTNQARGLAEYAFRFLSNDTDQVADECWQRLEMFHTDSVACATAALGIGANAPTILRQEALAHADQHGACCFGTNTTCEIAHVVLANTSAVRELDSNGTNFGYNPVTGDAAGEFGHNDFYPVVVAAAQSGRLDGPTTLKAMMCLDEIRGRLAEVFSLKSYRIDHVVHGGIASAVVYGALRGADVDQIESAIGMLLAHYIPFRAIRAGHQLSDSKGASAALTAEMAVRCVDRSIRGFLGPRDIFRNPQAIFRLFQPTTDDQSPFDLRLAIRGDDFAIMGMHFKLGLYEHQSAGAIQGLIQLLAANRQLLESPDRIERLRIRIYEPAFGIIGDPAKRNPQTRQSADHSMVYIIGTLLRKAIESRQADWASLMLLPADYDEDSLQHPLTRQFMEKIEFEHGGPDYDDRYPDGIPTSLEIIHSEGRADSGLVMYPLGHARHDGDQLPETLQLKFQRLMAIGGRNAELVLARCSNLLEKSAEQIRDIYWLS